VLPSFVKQSKSRVTAIVIEQSKSYNRGATIVSRTAKALPSFVKQSKSNSRADNNVCRAIAEAIPSLAEHQRLYHL
jgi:hypothetical protein